MENNVFHMLPRVGRDVHRRMQCERKRAREREREGGKGERERERVEEVRGN